MTAREYVYKITEVVKVTDGDTYWLRCDVGFRQNILINVRLLGYDCPEAHRGSEFERSEAIRARTFATEFLDPTHGGDGLWIQTKKDPDNFGRWLGDIWWEYTPMGPLHLGESLNKAELASVWPTRWHEEWDTP